MELKVFWTETALEMLEDIFDYYKSEVSTDIARQLVKKIVNRTLQLKSNPHSGPQEPLLELRKLEYRYLVEENYKIIYWVENNYVNIAAVFDTRQNPQRMKNI
jgi:plasmid stabilization system protein ParE